MDETIQAISTVGFPIVMCLIMLKIIKENEAINARVIDDLRNTINNNTIILTKIYERLEGDKDE